VEPDERRALDGGGRSGLHRRSAGAPAPAAARRGPRAMTVAVVWWMLRVPRACLTERTAEGRRPEHRFEWSPTSAARSTAAGLQGSTGAPPAPPLPPPRAAVRAR